MKKYIIDFINYLEGTKTSVKQLHWAADNLSQHKLCDDIADALSDFQDKVSEVEQSISGKFPLNSLKGEPYKVTTLKAFMDDVLSRTNSFYSKLKGEGDEYIGMRSDVEAFLSDFQRLSYLVDFTVKEGLKRRLRGQVNEGKLTVSDGKHAYRLTENELREVVREAIDNTIGMTNKQVRNELGIRDDDELNASVIGEEDEELEGAIWRGLCEFLGVDSLYKAVVEFKDVAEYLAREHAMKYIGPDNEDECHDFSDGVHILSIYPRHFYPSQGKMKIENFGLYRKNN